MKLTKYLEHIRSDDYPLDDDAWPLLRSPSRLWVNAIQYVIQGSATDLEAILQNGININTVFTKSIKCLAEGIDSSEDAVQQAISKFEYERDTGFGSVYNAYTLLHVAAQCNQVEIIKLLLRYGAEVDSVFLPGAGVEVAYTPLVDAAARGYLEAVESLLKAGADPNVEGDCYVIPLTSCLTGFNDTLASDELEQRGQILLLLLQYGADPNFCNGCHNTPVKMAVQANRLDLVRELVSKGASCEWTLENFVLGHGSEELLDFLVANGAKDVGEAVQAPAFGKQTTQEHANSIMLLLNRFPSFLSKTESINTLCMAARQGDLVLVRFLVDHGVDINGLGDYGGHEGWRPLFEAVWADSCEVLRWMLDHGADVNLTAAVPVGPEQYMWASTCATVLHSAVLSPQRSRQEAVDCLLRSGANVNQRNTQGATPLMLLCENWLRRGDGIGHEAEEPISSLLLGAGADINTAKNDGRTLLHILACPPGHYSRLSCESMVKFLLENGADPYVQSKTGRLPVEIALASSRTEDWTSTSPATTDMLVKYTSDFEWVSRQMAREGIFCR